MGQLINKKITISPETGEVINQKMWLASDGFTEKGFRYRAKASAKMSFFFDAVPPNLSPNAYYLLIEIIELMDDENALVYKVARKSKFSSIVRRAMDEEDIRTRMRHPYGINKFNEAWKELKKQCVKKVQYYELENVYVINPSIAYKGMYVPFWIYDEFQDYMNPHISAMTIKRLQERIDYQEY